MDRLFEKFQQKSRKAQHIRIRLIEPQVDVDSFIQNLSDTLAPLREQDPVLLHIDTAAVSLLLSLIEYYAGEKFKTIIYTTMCSYLLQFIVVYCLHVFIVRFILVSRNSCSICWFWAV